MFWPFQRRGKSIDEIADQIDAFSDGRTAGQVVTDRTALEVTAVLACVDVIASSCSVPEMHVMRALPGGRKEMATDDPVYRLLNRRPNDFQTSTEFRETITMHAALTGDGYALPVRDVRDGRLIELLPLLPHQVTINQYDRYTVVYTVADEFGVIGRFPHDRIFHLRNRSWDRVRGMSAVRSARKAIGLSMAVEDNLAKLHENGGRPAGILSSEQPLGSEAIARVKAGWAAMTQGAQRYRTAVLDQGLKYQPVAMSSVDAQTQETRRQQVEEICRAFGVFPIMIGHSDKTATYASAEAFFAANNRKTAAKWQMNWRQKVDEFLLDGAGPLFVEFENNEIKNANLKDQGEYFAKALGTGGGVPFMTVNEVRVLRGLQPIEGGDELRDPAASTVAPPKDEQNED